MYHNKNIKFKSVRGTRNWTGTTENTKGRREERLHPFPTSSFFPCLELHFHRVQLRHLQLSRWQPCPCLYYHYSSPANFLVKVTWAEFKSELFLTAFKERIAISVHNSTERGFTRGQSTVARCSAENEKGNSCCATRDILRGGPYDSARAARAIASWTVFQEIISTNSESITFDQSSKRTPL